MKKDTENFKLFFEKHTKNLYHYTHVSSFFNIIKADVFNLRRLDRTSSYDIPDVHLSRNKKFYGSFSRIKLGGFVKNQHYPHFKKLPIIVIEVDGEKLSNNYKIIPVDYFDDPESSEQEDRVISNRPNIPNFSKYIVGVHVYIPKYSILSRQFETIALDTNRTIYEFYHNEQLLSNRNIPIIYYDDIDQFSRYRPTKYHTNFNEYMRHIGHMLE